MEQFATIIASLGGVLLGFILGRTSLSQNPMQGIRKSMQNTKHLARIIKPEASLHSPHKNAQKELLLSEFPEEDV